jgi:protein-disulfide isomerase
MRLHLPPSHTLIAVALTAFTSVIAVACNTSDGATTTKGGATARTVAASATPADTFSDKIDHARIAGNPSAKVWMVMASDFQCPYCKQFHDQSFAALKHDYVDNGKVRIAFLNFPLQIHPNALPAAKVAMCAGAQGQFWAMHDALFAAQPRWAPQVNPRPVFDSLATSIGIDSKTMDACVASQLPDAMIQADIDRAERAGVQSTPTIIIGNTLIAGARPTAQFRQALDDALAASTKQ